MRPSPAAVAGAVCVPEASTVVVVRAPQASMVVAREPPVCGVADIGPQEVLLPDVELPDADMPPRAVATGIAAAIMVELGAVRPSAQPLVRRR